MSPQCLFKQDRHDSAPPPALTDILRVVELWLVIIYAYTGSANLKSLAAISDTLTFWVYFFQYIGNQ